MAGVKPDNIDILLPLWGSASVDMFLAYSLPALLAEGNLPALARRANVTFVFLSGEVDRPRIEAHASYARLAGTCAVAFEAIDDLIAPGAYGVTITLAFGRGLKRRGAAMTDFAFVLLMGDFILANGALAALYDQIGDRASAVFASSYRVPDETTAGILAALTDTHSGALHARELASIAIDNLHLTVRAQFVDNPICHATHVNQLYWRHDDDTVISHQFLMHLFCIRPERPLDTLNYFFDYGLFLDLCPSGRHAVIQDSDRFLALEMQSARSELNRIVWGPLAPDQIIASLAEWSGPIHRLLAAHALVLHRGDLKETIGALAVMPAMFVTDLLKRLPSPVPAAEHPYWRGALAGWRRNRERRKLHCSLTEFGIDLDRFGANERLSAAMRVALEARRLLVGDPPHVTMLSPSWAEFRALREEVGRIVAMAQGHIAIVSSEPELFDSLCPESATFDVISDDDGSVPPRGNYCAMIIDAPWDAGHLRRMLDMAHRLVQPGGEVLTVVRGNAASRYPDKIDAAEVLAALQNASARDIKIRVVAGLLRRMNVDLSASSVRDITSAELASRLKGIGKMVLLAGLALLSNIGQFGRQPAALLGTETMMLCRMRRGTSPDDARA